MNAQLKNRCSVTDRIISLLCYLFAFVCADLNIRFGLLLVCVCVCVCVYVYIYMYVHTHTHTHTYIHTLTWVYVSAWMDMARTHPHTHVYTKNNEICRWNESKKWKSEQKCLLPALNVLQEIFNLCILFFLVDNSFYFAELHVQDNKIKQHAFLLDSNMQFILRNQTCLRFCV